MIQILKYKIKLEREIRRIGHLFDINMIAIGSILLHHGNTMEFKLAYDLNILECETHQDGYQGTFELAYLKSGYPEGAGNSVPR